MTCRTAPPRSTRAPAPLTRPPRGRRWRRWWVAGGRANSAARSPPNRERPPPRARRRAHSPRASAASAPASPPHQYSAARLRPSPPPPPVPPRSILSRHPPLRHTPVTPSCPPFPPPLRGRPPTHLPPRARRCATVEGGRSSPLPPPRPILPELHRRRCCSRRWWWWWWWASRWPTSPPSSPRRRALPAAPARGRTCPAPTPWRCRRRHPRWRLALSMGRRWATLTRRLARGCAFSLVLRTADLGVGGEVGGGG